MTAPRRPLALVTGASQGIGAAVARQLAPRYDLLLGGRDPGRLETVVSQLTSGPDSARAWPVELTDDAALAAAVDGIDRLDVLVHSAGIGLLGTVSETGTDTWRRQFDTNVVAVAELTRLLLPALRAAGSDAGSDVVLINSGSGLSARAGWGSYAASKFALHAFGDALRAEESGHGVRVTSVHPGRVDTEMQRAVVEHERSAAGTSIDTERSAAGTSIDTERSAAGTDGGYDGSKFLRPESVAAAVLAAVTASRDAHLTEVVLRPGG